MSETGAVESGCAPYVDGMSVAACLTSLLEGYFHQDFSSDTGSAAVAVFLFAAGGGDAEALAAEADRLVAELPEAELLSVVEDAGVEVDIPAVYGSAQRFLAVISLAARATLARGGDWPADAMRVEPAWDSRSDETWVTVGRPGYFGSRRDVKHAEFDREYGAGGWRLAWKVDDAAFNRQQMTMLYEDAYYEVMSAQPDIVDQLVAEASDVYDDASTNILSGLDYHRQETARTHVQDIAIRRVVARLGRAFAGDRLIQIRDELGDHPLSMTLSPGRVPFHRPDLLMQPELEGWWKPGSVESFYQSNKILQRRGR